MTATARGDRSASAPAPAAAPAAAAVESSALADAAQAKAFAAEQRTAIVRFAVIAFNIPAYYIWYAPQGDPVLAAIISVVAGAYGVYDLFARPYRHFPVMLTSYWTAVTDGVLITLWIHASGDGASPFYLLWYLSLVAVAFRYDWRATGLAAILYAMAYVSLLAVTGDLVGMAGAVAVRVAYILLVGALGALLARELTRAFAERSRMALQVRDAEMQRAAFEVGRLRDLDRFKGEFINAAAHELNTPLTPLRLELHVLKHRLETRPEDQRSLMLLERNLGRLSSLVQDMLDVARLDSGQLRLDPRRTDLAALARESCDTFSNMAQQRKVELSCQAPEALAVDVDPKRITQVLDNLLSNALKFTPEGGHVRMRAFGVAGHASLEVSDDGVGLTTEQVQRLFHPFVQLHRDTVLTPGTGLGLYISRGLVERHHGTLECTSPGQGKGSTFTVRLPTSQAGSSALVANAESVHS